MRSILLITWYLCCLSLEAQLDSVIFSPEQLGQWLQQHPIYKVAALQERETRMNRLRNRGQFDPKVEFGLDKKEFDGKEYYDLQKYGMKVATWPGIDLQAEVKDNSGVYLDPQNNLPKGGVFELGADAQLLRGLLYDKRRAALEQSRVFRMANEAERRDMLNDLNASALSAYWQWAAAHAKYRFSKKGVGFAQLTFRLVKESFTSGFASELDTVEALSALLKRRMGLEKVRMELSKTRYQLSSFLWGPDQLPILLSDDAFPVDIRKRSVPLLLRDSLDRMIQALPSTSPALLAMQAKNADLIIHRKLALNNLLPEARLQYRWVTPQDQALDSENFEMGSNYRLGMGFSLPLFLRKERAYLELNKIKRTEQVFKMAQKQNDLANKLRGFYEALQTYWRNSQTAQRATTQFQRLLEVEMRKSAMGESSLFRVNKRQDDLIKIGFDWIDNLKAYELQRIELYRISGQLTN